MRTRLVEKLARHRAEARTAQRRRRYVSPSRNRRADLTREIRAFAVTGVTKTDRATLFGIINAACRILGRCWRGREVTREQRDVILEACEQQVQAVRLRV